MESNLDCNLKFQTNNKIDTKLTRSFFNCTNMNLFEINTCTQNIDWSTIGNTRENLRRHRMIHHVGFRNSEDSSKEKHLRGEFFKETEKDIFYQFSDFFIDIPINVQHFQLRKNLKMLNSYEIVYMRTFGIEKLNLLTNKKQFLVIYSAEDNEESSKIVNFDICIKNDHIHIVCGKINGSIVIFSIKLANINNLTSSKAPSSSTFRMRVADEGESQITNHVQFIDNNSKLLICSNDSQVKIFDLECNMNLLKKFKAPAAVNHFTINNTENILSCVGDFETVELYDFKTTQHISSLKGHLDFGFSAYFKPNSDYILATGNQDFSCRLWDLRKTKSNDLDELNFKTLYGHFESIGEMCFISEDLILYAENTDFLHLYDLKRDTMQTLDFFGSSAGLCVNKETKKVYCAISEYSHFGIMTFDMIKDSMYSLNSI